MVSLRMQKGDTLVHYCGATLISPIALLTAAHCAYLNTSAAGERPPKLKHSQITQCLLVEHCLHLLNSTQRLLQCYVHDHACNDACMPVYADLILYLNRNA